MNRQKVVLAILVVGLLIAVGTSIIRFPRQQTVDKRVLDSDGKTGVSSITKGARDDAQLHLELLQKNQVSFNGFKRNIFAPIFRDFSKLPPVKPVKVTTPPPPPPPPPVVPESPEAVMQRDLAQFTFVGFLDKERKKTIFLSKNKEIFLVKKGERIAGKYEAAAITDEALTIRAVDGGTAVVTIPLVENKALITKSSSQRASRKGQGDHSSGASPVPVD